MDILSIGSSQTTPQTEPISSGELENSAKFLWLDATHEEVEADPEGWRDTVERYTGVRIYDPHLSDVVNPAHPTYFDSANDYAMLVFRKLVLNSPTSSETAAPKRNLPSALRRLTTIPVTFLLTDHALITVHAPDSRIITAQRARLLDAKVSTPSTTTRTNWHSNRRPISPEDLMLRLLNALVDQYLELRQPLTTQLDHWQRALLDPRRPFKNWGALLEARIELRKLDHLCEEQHDAMQELRDYVVDTTEGAQITRSNDLLLVRVNDVMEHITRVLHHARHMEASLESAVQIHFSAMSHRTSEIMRTLTVITALFMPLTLITGIFGMNFTEMPLLRNSWGFWLTMTVMLVIVIAMLLLFRRSRFLDQPRLSHPDASD
ncbi:MAG: magnesium transporter CorA family protein [Herbaspirillum sp.]